LTGGEVFNRLQDQRRIDERTVSRWMFDLTRAFQYMHRLGVIHRDIKRKFLVFLIKNHQIHGRLRTFLIFLCPSLTPPKTIAECMHAEFDYCSRKLVADGR